ncbi:ankyrin repeat domain-containing protein [Candidatus Babeliales bacterium]|nr:ankyrin repeat domain-containing protein [Candidatus Babeliales bacterium]
MISKISKVVTCALLLGGPVWAASSSWTSNLDEFERARATDEKMFIAVELGNTTKLAELLLSSQALAGDVCNHDGATLLHWAVRHDKINVIEWLRNNVAPGLVNAQDNKGRTPLHYAAEKGNVGVVKALCESFERINVNAPDETGATPLHDAAFFRSQAAFCWLVQNRKDIDFHAHDQTGATPLHYAVQAGLKEAVLCLCNHDDSLRLDVNARDLTGSTPLHYATIDRFADIADQCAVVAALIKRGANKNALNLKREMALAPHARLCLAAFLGNVEAMRGAHALGASPHAQDAKGCTPLHYAVMSRNIYAMEFLLGHRVQIVVTNNAGATPMCIAQQVQDEGAVKMLNLFFRASAH